MPATAQIIAFRPTRERPNVAERMEDELYADRILSPAEVIEGLKARGRVIAISSRTATDDQSAERVAALDTATPFVSPYLCQPCRTEEQARRELGRPRPAQVQSVFQRILAWVTP